MLEMKLKLQQYNATRQLDGRGREAVIDRPMSQTEVASFLLQHEMG